MLPQIVETATFPGQDPDFSRFGVTAKRKYPLWGKISHPLTISPFLPILSDSIPSYISQIRISREGFLEVFSRFLLISFSDKKLKEPRCLWGSGEASLEIPVFSYLFLSISRNDWREIRKWMEMEGNIIRNEEKCIGNIQECYEVLPWFFSCPVLFSKRIYGIFPSFSRLFPPVPLESN